MEAPAGGGEGFDATEEGEEFGDVLVYFGAVMFASENV